MEDKTKMSNGLHRAVLIMACVAAVLLFVYWVLDVAYSGHVPFWMTKCTAGPALIGLAVCLLSEVGYGLYLCFVQISKWARIDLWGHYLSMLVGIVFISGVFVVLFAFWVKWKYPSLPSRGEFGDSFGALNALFSTCAFIALLVSLVMQRRQMLDERTRIEKDQEDKRRERWPAVVIPEMKGNVFALGMTGDNKLTVLWKMIFRVKNISRVHVLNVSARVLKEQFSADGLYSEMKTEWIPYIEKDGSHQFSVVGVEKIRDVDHMIAVFSDDVGRRIEIKVGMATAQGFYYSVTESFRLHAKDLQVMHRKLLAVKTWMSIEEGRRLTLPATEGAKIKFTAYPQKADKMPVQFEVLPSSYALAEIGRSEFDAFTGNNKKTFLS